MGRVAPDAELKALAQHRKRDRPSHDGAGLLGSGLAAVIVIADLDRGEPHPERPFEIEITPGRQLIARRARRGLIDHLPDFAREGRLVAVEGVHHRAPFKEPIVPTAPPDRAPSAGPGPLSAASAAFSMPGMGVSVKR